MAPGRGEAGRWPGHQPPWPSVPSTSQVSPAWPHCDAQALQSPCCSSHGQDKHLSNGSRSLSLLPCRAEGATWSSPSPGTAAPSSWAPSGEAQDGVAMGCCARGAALASPSPFCHLQLPQKAAGKGLLRPLRLTLASKLGPGERAGGGAVEGSIDSINQRDCNQSKGLVTATTRDLGLRPAWTKEESSQKLSKVSTLPTQPSPSQH